MGEIIGGVIVVIIFIAFVMWRNKKKPRQIDDIKRFHEEQYWAEKDARQTEVSSSDPDDSDD